MGICSNSTASSEVATSESRLEFADKG
jgi:hypothetical protein